MQPLFRLFLRSIFFLALFLFFFTLGINVYLNFSGIKEKTVLQAQEALGKQLQVGSIYFFPWSGLHVESVMIVDSERPVSLRVTSLVIGTGSILKAFKSKKQWSGELQIKKIFFNDHPVLKKIVAEISWENDLFAINSFTAQLLGGKIQGTMTFQKGNQFFSLYQGNTSFFDVPLKEALSGTAFQQKMSAGKIQGTINFEGIVEKPESLHGSGTMELLGGELKTADFFGTLSRLFPMEEFQLLKLHEAKINYAFSSERLRLNAAQLKSDNMAFSAYGNISSKGEVTLEAQLFLNAKIAKYFEGVLPPDLTNMVNQIGYCEIPFQIDGSIMNLHTNFSEKIFTQQIPNNVNGLLQEILNKALK